MFNIPRRFRGIKRFEEILRIFAKHELGFALEKFGLKNRSFYSKHKLHRPVEVRMLFEELGGTFIKLGQLLSLRPDLIPHEYCEELSSLQDDIKPFSYEEVKSIIFSELKKPVNKLFRTFDKKPIASASIGQVHVATLKNKKKVAVKVMRPGISALMQTDLEIMEYLVNVIKGHADKDAAKKDAAGDGSSSFLGAIDIESIFSEFKRYTEGELDYLKEADNIDAFFRAGAGRKIRIPKVFSELTSKRVLTMEFLDGVELRKIIINPGNYKRIDKKKISQLIVDDVIRQVFVDGIFHADPHPGNIIVNARSQGKRTALSFGLIDFGIIGKLDKSIKDEMLLLFFALLNRDASRLLDVMAALSIVTPDVDADALKRDLSDALGRYYDASLESIDVKELFFSLFRIARKHRLSIPKEFVMLGKSLITLQGIGLSLDPEFNLVRETKPIIAKLMRKKNPSGSVLKHIISESLRFSEFVYSLPDQAKALQSSMRKADDYLDTINNDIRSLTSEISIISFRLIVGIIISALAIGASLVYRSSETVALVLIGISVVLFIYLAWSYLDDRSFHRR